MLSPERLVGVAPTRQRGCEVPERIHLFLGFDENESRFPRIARHDPGLAQQLFEKCGDRLILLLGLPDGVGLDSVAAL
jgi:hypothetical protein